MRREAFLYLAVILCRQGVQADGNDWINPQFVLSKTGAPKAQQTITTYAKNMAKQGPWTVFGKSKILPPSGDKLDYLSWAPYHWPDCNWCTGPRSHLASGSNRTQSDGDPDSVLGNESGDNDPYADAGGSDGTDDGSEGEGSDTEDGLIDWESDGDDDINGLDIADDVDDDESKKPELPTSSSTLPISHRRMMRRIRRMTHPQAQARQVESDQNFTSMSKETPSPTLPDDLPTDLPGTDASTTAENIASGTNGVAANAKKTKPVPKPKKTSSPKANGNSKPTTAQQKCTPSPTKSLPPSATWTTCKYVTRDGKVNPDVRELAGVSMFADAAQGIVYNALASVFTGSDVYAQNAAKFVNTFFLDHSTGMHPRIEYGQVIRGPGKQVGQYLGVLDLRAMVKVANAIQILRASHSSYWTDSLDKGMAAWASQYVQWLHSSSQGQKALAAPNNHGTFAANQLAAIAIVEGSSTNANTALAAYFNGQFKDQVAASGEQPYEAARTRPFHYRCFNLEAMITNAKLGDQIGQNYWVTKSKYGATIQDALNFVMKKGPGKEDIADIFPLVAAVAAAYGDPKGQYDAYLRQNDKRYQAAPYYYYDQPGALTKAPAAGRGKGTGKEDEDADRLSSEPLLDISTPTQAPVATPTIPFECPAAFASATQVELDDGIYVTCDELKPFYGYVDTARDST